MSTQLSKKRLTDLPVWGELKTHHRAIEKRHMRDLFTQHPQRFSDFSRQAASILVDYSKNCITHETLHLLTTLAKQTQLADHIDKLFSGHPVNFTENRAAMHAALRNPTLHTNSPVQQNLNKMASFCEQLRAKQYLGFSRKPMTDVVNIGIGGSDLGPMMVTEALKPYADNTIRCHFVSNIDSTHITETLKILNPETTLFIISSKSFSTLETLTNAATAKKWLLQTANNADVQQHFVAISGDNAKAIAFGIHPDRIFEVWDWVGGRYSLWAATGLPIAIAIGIDNFKELLAGAHEMDQHFQNTDFMSNIPVILALLGIWYHNFFGAQTHAIFPYHHYLRYLPAYLQQLDMESNGKNISSAGTTINYTTGPVIWGGVGCNGQHAFHQLLHQGTQFISADFIIPARSHHAFDAHHPILFANCLGQTQALMQGKTLDEAFAELIAAGYAIPEAQKLAPHKMMPGNRPTNTITFSQLTPRVLGALLALYEHKVFVQGVIWNINSFDQWGVELGKQLVNRIIPALTDKSLLGQYHDSSTQGLISYYAHYTSKYSF